MRKSPREYFGVQSNKRGKHTLWGGGYQPGNHWVECEVCGCDIRAFDIKLRWDGLRVCPDDWETRHPQDFVRGRHDDIRAKEPVRSSSLSTADLERAIDTGSLGGDSVDDDLICRLVYDYSRISTPNIAVPNLAVPNVEDPTVTEVCTPNPNNPPTSNIPDPTFGNGGDTPDPTPPPPPPPPTFVTGAQASDFNFDSLFSLSVFNTALAYHNNIIYAVAGNQLSRYDMDGNRLSTQFLNFAGGSIPSITVDTNGNLVLLINRSTPGNPAFSLRSAQPTPPHVFGPEQPLVNASWISSQTDITADPDGTYWVVSNIDDMIRNINFDGTVNSSFSTLAQGQNATNITYVEGDLWVVEENADQAQRYSIDTQSFTGDTFTLDENNTFGLTYDGTNFWVGGANTGDIYRRPAIRTTQ